jgi:hypothetical protein
MPAPFFMKSSRPLFKKGRREAVRYSAVEKGLEKYQDIVVPEVTRGVMIHIESLAHHYDKIQIIVIRLPP